MNNSEKIEFKLSIFGKLTFGFLFLSLLVVDVFIGIALFSSKDNIISLIFMGMIFCIILILAKTALSVTLFKILLIPNSSVIFINGLSGTKVFKKNEIEKWGLIKIHEGSILPAAFVRHYLLWIKNPQGKVVVYPVFIPKKQIYPSLPDKLSIEKHFTDTLGTKPQNFKMTLFKEERMLLRAFLNL